MKQIPLTQGKYALVDDEDYDFINQRKWHCNSSGYAVRATSYKNAENRTVKTKLFMHRIINKTLEKMYTDHINGNPLDNRKSNLRTCTTAQNNANRIKALGTTSKYNGVHWCKRDTAWIAAIRIDGKKKVLGYFKSEAEAALAYNEAAIKHHGEFALLNKIEDCGMVAR